MAADQLNRITFSMHIVENVMRGGPVATISAATPKRITKRLVAQLEGLGHNVTLEAVAA